ncbi:hypothetical protein SAMN05444062_103690 [Pseudomonas syringae]|nr:hypothetical protein SAMN05444062_103690 [Pseudomonas syringae]
MTIALTIDYIPKRFPKNLTSCKSLIAGFKIIYSFYVGARPKQVHNNLPPNKAHIKTAFH